MRSSHRVLAVVLRWSITRIAITSCIVALIPWLLLDTVFVRVPHSIAGWLLRPSQSFSTVEPTSPILIAPLLGYGLTVVALLALVIRLRQDRVLEWVDRVSQLRGEPNIDEVLEELGSYDPPIRAIIARTHAASVQHRTLNTINQCISSYIQLEVILPEITKSAAELLRASSGCVALASEDGVCHNVGLYNLPDKMQRVEIPKSVGVVGEVIESGKAIIIDDYSKYERRFRRWDSYGFKAIIGVPLVVEGRRIGALVVTTQDPCRRFAQVDVDLLTSFANQAAIAIKNARLYYENLQRIQELQRAKKELASRTAQLRHLLSKSFQNEDEVRNRISADIHDGITQHVVGALFQIQSISPLVRSGQPPAELALKRLDVAADLLNQTVKEMYHVIRDLRSPRLDEMALVQAVQSYIENLQVASGITCHLDVIGCEREISPDKHIAIYRILQEALNNVRKHSGVALSEICMEFHSNRILVTVRDYGKGFVQNSRVHRANEHLGITYMEERAYSIGGRLKIRSALGRGTTVVLEIPDESRDKAADELVRERQDQAVAKRDPARRR